MKDTDAARLACWPLVQEDWDEALLGAVIIRAVAEDRTHVMVVADARAWVEDDDPLAMVPDPPTYLWSRATRQAERLGNLDAMERRATMDPIPW
jgi:hypothetical protein